MRWFVFVALYAVLTAIRRRWFVRHHALEHEALMVRATAAVTALAHLETLLKAVDAEIARREAAKA